MVGKLYLVFHLSLRIAVDADAKLWIKLLFTMWKFECV